MKLLHHPGHGNCMSKCYMKETGLVWGYWGRFPSHPRGFFCSSWPSGSCRPSCFYPVGELTLADSPRSHVMSCRVVTLEFYMQHFLRGFDISFHVLKKNAFSYPSALFFFLNRNINCCPSCWNSWLITCHMQDSWTFPGPLLVTLWVGGLSWATSPKTQQSTIFFQIHSLQLKSTWGKKRCFQRDRIY